MKVFVINVVCGTGSTGRVVEDIYQLLIKNGHQCRVAYSRGALRTDMDALKIGSKADMYGHALLSRITDKQGQYSRKATKELIEEITAYEPDVIHLHNIHGHFLNFEVLFDFLKKYDKPVIWTLHDCWSFTGHCAYFSRVQCEKWKTGCFACSQSKEYPAAWFADHSKENWLAKKQAFLGLHITIVTVSEWLKSLVEQSFLGQYEVRTIYNGLDLEVFKPMESDFKAKHGIQDRYMILGVANQWTERKGFEDFLQLADMLGESFVVVLVGVTKEQKSRLKPHMMGIENTADTRELVEIYSAADVYVNASVEETFGMTTLEALACGTPAIAYGVTGIPEALRDMPEMIVAPHDLGRVKEQIVKVCREGVERETLLNIAAGYNKWERFKEYIDLYVEKMK